MSKTKERQFLGKLYKWHAWAGFQLSIVMFTILFTGTVATISNEIDWLIFDEMRTFNAPDDIELNSADWEQMYAALHQYLAEKNDGSYVQRLYSMGADYFTFRARITVPDGNAYFLHIDQWTKQVTGEVPLLTVQRFFRDFHRYLFMPAFPGIIIVCTFAFVLTLSLYTGLKTTRNWKTALTRVRADRGPRILLSDLHKISGLWGSWFFVVIIVTSFWYLFEFGVHVSGNRLSPSAPKIERIIDHQSELSVSPEDFGTAIATADDAIDWTITTINFPFSATGSMRFMGVGINPLLRERAHSVDIHPLTLDIIEVRTPSTITTGNYLNEYADPIHFGYFGGLTTKLIWFVFGIGLTALSVTGVLMTWKRTKSHRLTQAQVATLPILGLALVAFVFWLQRFT